MSGATSPWRTLVARVGSWKRDAYVPLHVALSADEQLCHQCADSTMLAGFVRKDRIEVRDCVSGVLPSRV